MSAHQLLVRLCVAGAAFTLLTMLMLASRARLRRWIGAELAYACWLLVPLALLCCCWPTHQVLVHVAAAPALPAVAGDSVVALAETRPTLQWTPLILAAWLGGAALAMLTAVLRQRRFMRRLGQLRALGENVFISEHSGSGPLLAGLLSPRIVLPADFAQRYTASEQALVLAHERAHWQRGDLLANAIAEGLLALFWFNPVARAARRAFLLDQEMACDAAVLRQAQTSPRQYAEALLKTQTSDLRLPLGCTMQALPPIKERIMNLNQKKPSIALRRLCGGVLAMVAAGAGCAAWALTADQVMVPLASTLTRPAPLAGTDKNSVTAASMNTESTTAHRPALAAAKAIQTQQAARIVPAPSAAIAKTGFTIEAPALIFGATPSNQPAPADPNAAPAGNNVMMRAEKITLNPPDAVTPAALDEEAGFLLTIELAIDGGAPVRQDDIAAKHRFALNNFHDGEGKPCALDGIPAGAPEGKIDVRMTLTCGGQIISQPHLLTKDGEAITVSGGRQERQADGSYAMTKGFKLKLKLTRV